MNKSKVLIVYIIAIILTVPFLQGCSREYSPNQPKAENGALDFTEWQEEEVIRLDGEWEFYWKQLLEPRDLESNSSEGNTFVEIPSSWNQYPMNDEKSSGEGYATYKLSFKTKEDERLGLKIPRVLTAYKLWVNSELVASAGTVGKNREYMTPQYLPQVALFTAKQGENEIVLQVSNFYHRSGGMLESLRLGSEKEILKFRDQKLAYELVLFGSLVIIGAYHLILFIFRKKDYGPLYFGLFCLLVGIRTLFVGEGFFISLFPSFSWEVVHKIQTLVFYLGLPVILTFFKDFFPNSFSRKIMRFVQIVGMIFSGLVLLTPAKIFTLANPVYQIFTIFIMIYIMYVLIKLLLKKEEGVGFIFAGALALIITSLNDMVFLSIWMNDHSSPLLRSIFRTGNLSAAGQLIFVFTNAVVLAKRFSNVLEKEEIMTTQLREINEDLDQLVVQRTQDLEKSKKEIEKQKKQLEEANNTLQLMSLKDPLTGLWNRRKYDDTLLMEWRRCLRYKRPISLLILDIDYFKAYNDSYGHSAGDDCLIKIAQAINGSFKRASDLVVRYGGEEFVVIMPEAGKDEAMQMALFLKKKIEDLQIPHKSSSISKWVTVSIGVTSRIPVESSCPKDLFLVVDKALYEAKAAGRNEMRFLSE